VELWTSFKQQHATSNRLLRFAVDADHWKKSWNKGFEAAAFA
jgi:hypothetical protein